MTIKLTPRYRIFIEKLAGTQLVKKFPSFMEPQVHRLVHKSLSRGGWIH